MDNPWKRMEVIQIVWNIINTVIATGAAYYAFTQVRLIRAQQKKAELQEKEDIAWSIRAADVQQQLLGFMLKHTNGLNGAPSGPLYPAVIPDGDLRGMIESYLVRLDLGRNHVEARTLNPVQLRLPAIQATIKGVELRIAVLRRDAPQIARLASLL
jgi:hypothetical protein